MCQLKIARVENLSVLHDDETSIKTAFSTVRLFAGYADVAFL
jgi:hypothetical protein